MLAEWINTQGHAVNWRQQSLEVVTLHMVLACGLMLVSEVEVSRSRNMRDTGVRAQFVKMTIEIGRLYACDAAAMLQ